MAVLTRGSTNRLMKPELVTTRYATSSKIASTTATHTAIRTTTRSRLGPFSIVSESIVAIKLQGQRRGAVIVSLVISPAACFCPKITLRSDNVSNGLFKSRRKYLPGFAAITLGMIGRRAKPAPDSGPGGLHACFEDWPDSNQRRITAKRSDRTGTGGWLKHP